MQSAQAKPKTKTKNCHFEVFIISIIYLAEHTWEMANKMVVTCSNTFAYSKFGLSLYKRCCLLFYSSLSYTNQLKLCTFISYLSSNLKSKCILCTATTISCLLFPVRLEGNVVVVFLGVTEKRVYKLSSTTR